MSASEASSTLTRPTMYGDTLDDDVVTDPGHSDGASIWAE
jgi:hypothetical protein